ncbi:MAG: hypothetical protein E5Y12_15145 [Mesorhizobium sp.]|uniref:hypothetical protein n=1 Tax=Mesorhizobium sp. TaxID=1871066 RepID=UPI001203DD8F|nr:hypothetical protein [Mesorhizobium sp.]TIN92373.1 MAG: hypothetical protein E5Y06_23600 [Mesorhizobium sp.]TJU95139.1 MAG: hypothetical protein E5Y08_27010 [Mesorhizobium sp.]TJV03798.1 MAG: hypothetical protein E5Y12_15145 [Mesorhizobium sp.]
MRSEAYDYHEPEPKNLAAEYAGLQTPDDVLKEEMTIGAKRALLAFWASDVHAVPGRPALRRLDNGAIVEVGDILRALNQLDEIEGKPSVSRRRSNGGRSSDRRRDKARRSWLRYPWRDDDDDPPPVPAYVAVPPRRGDGGVFAEPEHAAA